MSKGDQERLAPSSLPASAATVISAEGDLKSQAILPVVPTTIAIITSKVFVVPVICADNHALGARIAVVAIRTMIPSVGESGGGTRDDGRCKQNRNQSFHGRTYLSQVALK